MREAVAIVHQKIEALFGVKLETADWAITPNPELGDIAIPCFKYAKLEKTSPADLAGRWAAGLEAELAARPSPWIVSVASAGPYVNFKINHLKWFSELRRELGTSKRFGQTEVGAGKTIVIDFSSPNVAKEIALHHLRSTAIGNSLAKIAELHGHRVERVNYLGDWGTTHGKLIIAYQMWGDENRLKNERVGYMLELYVRYNKLEKEDVTYTQKAKEAFSELEKGNAEYHKIWSLFRDYSIEEFRKLYDRLNIHFDHYDGESFYTGELDAVVNEITTKIGTRHSEGALVCDLPGHKVPALLKKDDGASLYLTRDVAAIADRYARFDFSEAWYVVAIQQKLHFEQLFKIVELLGKPYAGRLTHVAFGMLAFGDKTMKTREGNVIFLKDVLDEARERALKLIEEKNPALPSKEAVAEAVGMSAILFNDLSQNRIKDVKFDWDKALSFEGDTGPFIQYAHARSASLIRKVEAKGPVPAVDPASLTGTAVLEHDVVRALVKELALYKNFVQRAYTDKDPSQVGHALLACAKAMNRVYHEIRFLELEDRAALAVLLDLTRAVKQVLREGLELLGISAPEEM
ncbi:MAG TPA: arginine--tRNA ligase [Bdellovibrionota bacterium]|jgi:arginyl-tRNA synthetase|nr:arginine--tRNA ligase [Bdellovibrionota bacterium]